MPSRNGQWVTGERDVVLCLVVGGTERARIQEALRGRHHVRFVEDVATLERLLGAVDVGISGVIVESHDANGTSSSVVIRALRESRPYIPIVGYCHAGIAYSSDVRTLALGGVHELLFHGIDDTGTALRAILAMAHQATVGELVANAIMPLVPERIWPFVKHVARHPAHSQRVTSVARALGYHRRTLVNHCAQAQLPPPQELIAWCRLAVVGYLLGTTARTIESIALQLDFPSDTALRNLVKRHTGMRATEVRATGGIRPVIAAFSRALQRKSSSANRTADRARS